MIDGETQAVSEVTLVEPTGPRYRRPSFMFAKRHGLLVSEFREDCADVVLSPAADPGALVELRRFVACPLKLRQVDEGEFEALLASTYEQGSNEAMQMMEGLGDDLDLFQVAQALPETEDLLESEDDAPIIRLINALLTEAVKENASDIHIEPFENRLVVRFRVDGVLREILEPKRVLAPLLVSRIKVMAKLDIAEKRLPQDGRISLRIAGRAVDVRVSTLPSGHGERVVLRLLDKQAGRLDLAHLGMSHRDQEVMDHLIQRPHGIVLVTGPTGSGKSTTLSALIDHINTNRPCHIVTIEDPLEYFHDSQKAIITQREIGSDVGSFPEAMRRVLRMDPDVILLGEMRDRETITTAITAAETGHLILGTLHTHDATHAINRMASVYETQHAALELDHILGIRAFERKLRQLGVQPEQRVAGLHAVALVDCHFGDDVAVEVVPASGTARCASRCSTPSRNSMRIAAAKSPRPAASSAAARTASRQGDREVVRRASDADGSTLVFTPGDSGS